jgi:two-component system, OmpR family, sensor histidine kinase BaeS
MSPRPTDRRRRGLATRLLAGQSLVLVAGALTTGLVATLVGPPIFHQHLLESGHEENSAELVHIEMAYREASLISLGVGLLMALMAATAVTWFLTRRLQQPLEEVTTAARELTRGHYATRVPDVGSGTELDTLAEAFNTMASRLEGTEDTRRRMLGDLAHELRTPIATLAAYHEGLQDGIAEVGPESRAVLTEQTERLARLADDIDDVSSAQEGRLDLTLRPEPVMELLWTAHDAMREAFADKGVDLVVDTAEGIGLRVRADRTRVGQLLTNLLTNALRHTPAGGLVTLSALLEDAEVALTVSDTGDGMTPEQLGHVCERFYRGDSARTRDSRGTGIGLTISKAIVDAHGGILTARSDGPGRGAALTALLPLAN